MAGRERIERLVLYGAAAIHAGLGGLMVAAPDVFFDEIGPFPPQNDHYLRDVATFYLAIAVVAFLAVRHVSWRLPVLVFLAIQYVLHTINHVVDVNEAEPVGIGISNIVSLAIGAAIFTALALRARTPAASSATDPPA